jgi:hypothetical protein
MGVKPTTAWLDDMQDRAVQCLLEQAVRLQVAADEQQQQQGNGGSRQAGSWRPHRQQQQQQQRLGTAGRSKQRTGSWQLRDVAQLLSALAEARHAVKPQLTAALWGATAASLAAADAAALTELLVALGELQLVPPAAWIQRYYAATSAGARRAVGYRPWQIAASVAALGRLAAAGLPCCSSAPQQQQQQDGVQDCSAWVVWMLRAADPHLQQGSGQHSFAPRDLVALLSGVAALQLQDSPARCEHILAALQGVLPRLNTAGLADAFEAVAALQQQQRQQAQVQAQLVLPDGLWQALLTEVAVKLPVFPADHLARVLQCVAACPGLQPTPLWLQVG